MGAFHNTIAAVSLALVCAVICAPTSKAPTAVPPTASPTSSSAAASSPASDACFKSLANSTDCLSFAETGSKEKTPDKKCCQALAALMENDPDCICVLLSQANTFGFDIDVERALSIPTLCNIGISSISKCSGAGSPAMAPAKGPTKPILPQNNTTLAPLPTGSTPKNGAGKTKIWKALFIVGIVMSSLIY